MDNQVNVNNNNSNYAVSDSKKVRKLDATSKEGKIIINPTVRYFRAEPEQYWADVNKTSKFSFGRSPNKDSKS